jgi:hypothetical protein
MLHETIRDVFLVVTPLRSSGWWLSSASMATSSVTSRIFAGMQSRIFAEMQSRIFAEMQSRIFAGMGGVEVSEVSDVGGWRHSSVRLRHNFIPGNVDVAWIRAVGFARRVGSHGGFVATRAKGMAYLRKRPVSLTEKISSDACDAWRAREISGKTKSRR